MEKAICPEIFPGKPRGYPALLGRKRGFHRKFSTMCKTCAPESGAKMTEKFTNSCKKWRNFQNAAYKMQIWLQISRTRLQNYRKITKMLQKRVDKVPGGYNCITTRASRTGEQMLKTN